jgi:hypothetical protein
MDTKTNLITFFLGQLADQVLRCPDLTVLGKVGKPAGNIDCIAECFKLYFRRLVIVTIKLLSFINARIENQFVVPALL